MLDYILSPQQIEVISALSSGANMTTAADQSGVHRNTIANWRRNEIPFQHALAHAQYDRAMRVRERTEDLVDLAFKTIHDILADPKAPAGVRLKATLAIIQTAGTPPEPKKQVTLEIEKVQIVKHVAPQPVKPEPEPNTHPNTHNDAQTAAPASSGQNVHKPSAPPRCINKPPKQAATSPAPAAATGNSSGAVSTSPIRLLPLSLEFHQWPSQSDMII